MFKLTHGLAKVYSINNKKDQKKGKTMAASTKTLHTFGTINDVYGNDWFTANQFAALEISTRDNFVTLKTLRKNGLIERKYVVSFYTTHAETDIQPDEWTGEEIQISANEWAAPHYVPVYRVAY